MNRLFIYLFFIASLISITNAIDQTDESEVKHQKNIHTKSGEVKIVYPNGLNVDENLFSNRSKEEVPYIFENVSIELFNEGKIEESKLNTIASIWCGNKNYDFITELEDYSPGVVNMIRSIKTTSDLNVVKQYLSSH